MSTKREKNNFEKRLFVAIDIPEEVRKTLYEALACLGDDKDIRRVNLSNIHITLKFLGEVTLDKIGKIKDAIRSVAEGFSRFEFEIKGSLDAFPNAKNASVIFVEVADRTSRMKEIYELLEKRLWEIGIKKEKREFLPHITVARIKKRKDIGKKIHEIDLGSGYKVECSKITLYESILRPEGPEYIILGEFSLK